MLIFQAQALRLWVVAERKTRIVKIELAIETSGDRARGIGEIVDRGMILS